MSFGAQPAAVDWQEVKEGGFLAEEAYEEEEEEVEDLDTTFSAQGFWEGDSFRLEQFPAEPATWYEGDVEVVQTMGTVDLIYYLPEEYAHLEHEAVTVEVGSWKTRVVVQQPGEKAEELQALTGSLHNAVWPRFSVWRLLQERGQKCLHLHLAKLEHRAWKCLWAAGWGSLGNAKRSRFAWKFTPAEGPDPYRSKEVFKVPHETPPPPIETDYRLDASALCLGMDDVEEEAEHFVLRLHFDRAELARLEAVMPLESILTADVQEEQLRVFLRVAGDLGEQRHLDVFRGRLQRRCMPELTGWRVVRAAKGEVGKGLRGEAFNPALEFTLVKSQEDRGEPWGRLFREREHALELAKEGTEKKDKVYRVCEEQLRARCEELLAASAAASPQAEPAASLALEADLAEPEPVEWLIDNSELRAPTKGLGYRRSRHMHDKDGEELALWGTTVLGVAMGDWVKVGQRYLPRRLNGKVVLTGDVIGLPLRE